MKHVGDVSGRLGCVWGSHGLDTAGAVAGARRQTCHRCGIDRPQEVEVYNGAEWGRDAIQREIAWHLVGSENDCDVL